VRYSWERRMLLRNPRKMGKCQYMPIYPITSPKFRARPLLSLRTFYRRRPKHSSLTYQSSLTLQKCTRMGDSYRQHSCISALEIPQTKVRQLEASHPFTQPQDFSVNSAFSTLSSPHTHNGSPQTPQNSNPNQH
jgi:hypothetical protein